MIFLPASIERTLERISEAYKRDIKKGRPYAKKQLEVFEAFKASLENGTSELLNCNYGREYEAKIRLMHKIEKFYDPLLQSDLNLILNDVFIQNGLIAQLDKLCADNKTQAGASALLNFIYTAHSSSWGPSDSDGFRIRDFRLAKSEKEFEEILNKFKNAEELSNSNNLFLDLATIRVAFIPVSREMIYKSKGIYEERSRFVNEIFATPLNFSDALKMYDLWHDVRETAIYYICAPTK